MRARLLRAAFAGIGIGLAMAAGLTWYGLQTTLPKGMTVSGWDVGGMEAADFDKGLKERVALLHGKPLAMTAELPGGEAAARQSTLGALGLATNAEALAAETERLLRGPVWERALRRWSWRGRTLTLALGLDEAAALAEAKRLWPELYASQPVNAKRSIAAGDRVVYTPEVPAARIDAAGLRAAALQALGLPGADAAGGPRGGEAPEAGALLPHPAALRPDGPLLAAEPLRVKAPVALVQP